MLGNVASSVHGYGADETGRYLQRLFLVTALTLAVQVRWGHRITLLLGPAGVLLAGVTLAGGQDPGVTYTSIALGGLLVAVMVPLGLARRLAVLFNANVVAVVLLIIGVTLLPTLCRMIHYSAGQAPWANWLFAALFMASMFLGHHFMRGIARATLIVWALLIGGATAFLLAGGLPDANTSGSGLAFLSPNFAGFQFDAGSLLSFFFCFIALIANDVGAMQAMGPLLGVPDLGKGLEKGMVITGVANTLSGLMGIIGPVNYALSPGVVLASGCASRRTLYPAAALLMILAFVPSAITLLGSIPSAVVAGILVYILVSQVAFGLALAARGESGGRRKPLLGVGLPVLLGGIVTFLPAQALDILPTALRPLIGNGFVVGVLASLALEHLLPVRQR